jgi:hypothetical protein
MMCILRHAPETNYAACIFMTTCPTLELRCLFTASTMVSSVCNVGILLWFMRPVRVCEC